MRAQTFVPAWFAVLAASTAFAHGPQIQLTIDNAKIVTRELILDGPYSNSLTAPKSVYVMPLLEFGGAWYARPNNTPSATLPGLPAFPSGPGLAYGYDLADGGPQAFAEGSVLSVALTGGLGRWNGTEFEESLTTGLKAFRGTNPNITSPPENFAISSNSGPYDDVFLPPVAANYGNDGPEVHASLRHVLLENGSPSNTPPDGVYLLGFDITTTQFGLGSSGRSYFVLNKNAPMSDVVAAVQSLHVAPELVQWVVPEPGCMALAGIGALTIKNSRRRRAGVREGNE